MRRLATLVVLAIFSPIMCAIALVTFIVLEIAGARRRTDKYRSGLSRPVEQALTRASETATAYMLRTGVTPSEYVRRVKAGEQ